MSVDVVSITIQARSDGIDAATRSLNNLADAAGRVENANASLNTSSTQTNTTQRATVSAVDTLLARYQRQTDLLGANVSQQNAYNVSMQGGTAAQVALAQQLGATVDAYRRLAADQAEAIRMNRQLDQSSRDVFAGLTGINQGLELLGKAWNVLKSVVGGFIEMADSITLMDSRLRIITKSSQDYSAAQADIYRIAQANNASLQNTAALYTKLYDPITRLGGTTKEVGRITEAFAATLRISGATAGQTSAAVLQFGEALGSGRLNGDELKSLSENAPRFMQVLADSLKVPTGALKAMGSEGKLTADIIGNALLESFDKLQKQASEVGNTVGGAMSDLKNDVLVAAGAFDKLTGTSGVVANSIQGVSFIVQAFANILKATAEESKTATDGLDAMGIIIKGLGTVLEIPILLFSDVVYVFKGIGREIGGIAAQIVAVMNRDFKAVGTIREQMLEDNKRAEVELRTFQDRIANLSKTAQSLSAGPGGGDSSGSATLKAAADEKSLTEVRMKLAGITKSYFDDLNSLQKSLESNLITQQEYTRLVSELAVKTYASSVAGKEAAKSQKDAEKIQRQYQQSFVDLINSINAKDAVLKSSLVSEERLTEAEKFAAKVQEDLANGAIKLVAVRGMSVAQQKNIIDATLQQYVVDSKAYELQKQINKEINSTQKESDSRVGSIQKRTAEVTAQVKAYNDLPEAIRSAGVTEKQMADNVSQAKIDALDDAIEAEKKEQIVNERKIDQYIEQKNALIELRDVQKENEANQKANTFNLAKPTRDKEEAAAAVEAWKSAGREIQDALTSSFDNVGKSIANMFKSYTDYSAERVAAEERYNKVVNQQLNNPDGEEKRRKLAIADANKQSDIQRAQIKGFADLAGAGASFFDKQSKGYKVLHALEVEMHLLEMAMMAEKLFTSLFVTTATTAGVVAGQVVETGAVVAGEAERNAAKVPGVFMSFMSALGPWGAAAAAVAIAAVLGGAFGGGGGVDTSSSAYRQKTQGTGSVLGDETAKSDSIAKSLEIVAKDSGLGLVHFQSMDNSLKAVVAGLGSLGTQIVQFGNVNKLSKDIANNQSGGWWGSVVNAIFGGKTTVKDAGITFGSGTVGSIATNGVNAQSYNDLHKSGGWFSSGSDSTQMKDLGAATNKQISDIINNLANTISAAATQLGVGGSAFEDHLKSFVVDLGKISLKDMTGDEVTKALNAIFSKLGDDMAAFAVDGLASFQKIGEGYLETLSRVANDLIQVQDVFAVLGKTLNLTGIDAVKASEGLINMFGSVDKLTSATQYFVDNFLTDSEKLVPIQKSLNAELTRLHLSTDLSVGDFKKLVMSQDLTTTSGQEMYAALMNIAPALKQVTDSEKELFDKRLDMQLTIANLEYNSSAATAIIAQQREIELAAMDASLRPLQERINLLNDEAAAADKLKNMAQGDFTALSKSIAKAKADAQAAYDAQAAILNAQISSLQTVRTNITALSNALDSALHTMVENTAMAMSRAQAQATLDQVLDSARKTGVLPKAEDLKDVLSTLSKDPANSFGSYADYIKDIGVTAGKISNLKDISDDKGTAADKQIAIAQQQLVLSKTALDKELAKYDAILAVAQQQLDAMNGTTVAIMSLTAALTMFNASVTSAINSQAGAIGSNGSPITSSVASESDIAGLYKSILGRDADSAGLAFWASQHTSASVIAQNFLTSPEYAASHPNGSHANGLDSVPFDGYTAKLHKGEMVLPAKQAKGVLQGEDLAGVIKAIEDSCKETTAAISPMQDDIRKLYKRIVDMSPNGQSLQTVAGPL